jgi:hypothetical protein
MSLTKVPTLTPLSWPVATAIALNLIPVIGVLFWGWSAFALIFLYWLENVVVGARTVASMFASAAIGGGVNWLGALFFGAFFTLHYGLFCFVHGVFVMALFGGGTAATGDGLLDLVGAASVLFAQQTNLAIGFGAIVAWQIVQLALFVTRGEAGSSNLPTLMAAPYPRIFVLHFTIIFAGFLLMLLDNPVAGLVVMTLVKMGWDVAEARKQAAAAPAEA